jgi:hypothetical protein
VVPILAAADAGADARQVDLQRLLALFFARLGHKARQRMSALDVAGLIGPHDRAIIQVDMARRATSTRYGCRGQTMAYDQQFQADPHAFMQNNIVYVAFANDTAGLQELAIQPRDPPTAVSNKPGYNVYMLRKARASDAYRLLAYVCPYNLNSVQAEMLGNQALYCFTPQMDGCTFGVGSQANGVVRVTHVNTNRAGASAGGDLNDHRTQQRKLQRNLALSKVGRNATLIEPDTYMDEGGQPYSLKATTYGRHAAFGAWTFHSQRYRHNAGTFFHGGVLNF